MKKRILSIVLAMLLVLPWIPKNAIQAEAASAMKSSAALVDMLKAREGFSATPYWDVSHWTIGYGTTCPDDKVAYYQKNPMSVEEATAEFAKALAGFEAAVNDYIDDYDLYLNQHQFDALVSFTYNCGDAWMSSTSGYFNTALREGGTADELIYGMCLYSSAGGQYILTNRRLTEANLYLNGEYNKVPEYLRCAFLDGNGGTVRYPVYGFDARSQLPVNVAFSHIPTGVDKEGKTFVCTLEGWYTEDGVKVEKLDSAVKDGQVLYARWTDPEGNVMTFSKGTPETVTVKVTASSVNVRKGPGTYYESVGSYKRGEAVALEETYEEIGYTWGKTAKGWFRLDYTDYDEVKDTQGEFPKNGVCTGMQVSIRKGPGTNYDRVARVDKGVWFTITEEQDGGSYRWGKISGGQYDGMWICLDYIRYGAKVTGVTLLQGPTKQEYIQGVESLQLEGSLILVKYDDGTTAARTLERTMVTSYDNTKLGQTTVTAAYEGYTVSFPVTVVKATVTFQDWDGTVLSTAQYAMGESPVVPVPPEREGDGTYFYAFSGWHREVKSVKGNMTYIATYQQSTDPDAVVIPQEITSSVYTVGEGILRKIPLNTTVEKLISGINESDYVAVYSGDTKCDPTSPVSTGMTLRLENAGQTIRSLTLVVTGDVNGDGGVTITDMINIKSQILGKETLTGIYAQAGDVNGDGSISITDFVQIKARLLGKGDITPN